MDSAAALKLVGKLYAQLAKQREEADEFDSYYEGDQKLAFASEQWAEFHKGRYKNFADNWCGVVANSPAERLALTGLRLPGGKKRKVNLLMEDWKRNEGEVQSSQGLLESIVAKRSYAIVWADDNDEPTFTWEHPGQVTILYAPGNARKKIAGLKSWVDEDTEYATLYTPDALWKFKRTVTGVKMNGNVTENGLTIVGKSTRMTDMGHGAWEPVEITESGDDEWPLSNPLGEVPIAEYANRPRLGRGPLSDIHGTRAMQDAINLLWAYLFGAADYAGFPARVVLGAEMPKIPVLDDNGQKIGERDVPLEELQKGRLLYLTGQNAQISQWDAAKLNVFTEVIEICVGHISAQSRTPSHYLITKGDNVPASGYELAEGGLVQKVLEQHLYFSIGAKDHFRLMALVRDDHKLAAAVAAGSVLWKNPAIRSEAQLADALLKKKQIGYPFEYLLELDGVEPGDIERIVEMKRREDRDLYLDDLTEKDAADDGADAAIGG